MQHRRSKLQAHRTEAVTQVPPGDRRRWTGGVLQGTSRQRRVQESSRRHRGPRTPARRRFHRSLPPHPKRTPPRRQPHPGSATRPGSRTARSCPGPGLRSRADCLAGTGRATVHRVLRCTVRVESARQKGYPRHSIEARESGIEGGGSMSRTTAGESVWPRGRYRPICIDIVVVRSCGRLAPVLPDRLRSRDQRPAGSSPATPRPAPCQARQGCRHY
jgi:hypothetical protein